MKLYDGHVTLTAESYANIITIINELERRNEILSEQIEQVKDNISRDLAWSIDKRFMYPSVDIKSLAPIIKNLDEIIEEYKKDFEGSNK